MVDVLGASRDGLGLGHVAQPLDHVVQLVGDDARLGLQQIVGLAQDRELILQQFPVLGAAGRAFRHGGVQPRHGGIQAVDR